MDTRELQGLSFRCLEGCGFCCTFTPEVAHDELARLRRGFPQLPVVREGERLRLGFQGGCGACTLLSRRQCLAYADRPAHCRYFPFHVYFGRRTEAYVNRTCRGVEWRGGDLTQAFQSQVLGVARPHQVAEHERLARKVHAEFERNAREAGAWGDLDAAIQQAIAAQEPLSEEDWEAALAPFAEADVVARPFHLAADLRWLTFGWDGGRMQPFEMQEDGSLRPAGEAFPLERRDIDPALADPILRRLAGRDLFAGSVAWLVDDSGYALAVGEATRLRVRQVCADLAVRAAILERLGIPPHAMAEELERFHDSAFLDAPTVGGWL